MKRLILTTDDSGAGCLMQTGLADIVIGFIYQFAWGPLPSDADLASSLRRHDPDYYWWKLYRRHFGDVGRDEIGLLDFCERCDEIELWIDPNPSAQLMLIWLLDYLRPHKEIASKLTLVQSKTRIGGMTPKQVARWQLSPVEVVDDHFDIAGLAWRAYRRPTPEAWFDLLDQDIGLLPQLRQTVIELLEELPMPATGLGATEMRMLQLASKRRVGPHELFPGHLKPNKRRVFGYWEVSALLDGLARCPAPALLGLNEGPFTAEMPYTRDQSRRYRRSRLSITRFGQAVLARTEDFRRHNPIHRWWGGTELTNDNLWRWDPANQALIVP